MEAASDQQLIDQAVQGNHQAFAALYDRHRDWAFRLAWRFCQDKDLAMDVLQEVFVYVAEKLPTLVLRAKFRSLLYPAIRNLSLNHLRAQRRFAGPSEDLLTLMPSSSSTRDASWPEDLVTVLSTLTTAHREVLLMRFVDDMSLADIAEALGIPTGTVKSRLHHALSALRQNPDCRRYFLK